MNETSLATLQNKVRQIEIISNRLVNDQLAGEYHSVFKGQGMEFEEVRLYVPGDEIRSIDWNVTARAGAAHVKRYREERELTVMIVVDVSASCRFGTRQEFKSELMAEVCAVLAFATIANQDRVGLILCSDQIELVVPAGKGRRHTLRLVREILGFEPKGCRTNMGLALEHLRHVMHRKSVVFLLSDFLDLDGDFEPMLAAAARRHDVISIAFDDPFEARLPNVGLLDVVDPETGEIVAIDTSDPRLRGEYEAAHAARRTERKRIMNRNEAGLIEIENGKPYAADLVRFFRWRARRRI